MALTGDDELHEIAERASTLVDAEPAWMSGNGLARHVQDATTHLQTVSHSWQPRDLSAEAAAPPEPPTICGLLYPGRRHLFSGETESLKTMVSLALCVDIIHSGGAVAYIDFENGPREMRSRLLALGLTDQQIAEQFLYFEPDEPFTADTIVRLDVIGVLARHRAALVVIDALSGALALHGLDPNSGVDVERFYRDVIDPLRSDGAAVLSLDHVGKDKEKRGRYSIGSERKASASEIHLGLEVVKPFGRGRTGLVRLTTHKDRPGHLARPRAGDIELVSDPDFGGITWAIRPAAPDEPDEQPHRFRPTGLMERVSVYLELVHEPASRNVIEANVKGKAQYVRAAIDVLISEGFATENAERGARLVALQRPFREADDTQPRPQPGDEVPRPHLVPTATTPKPHD